MASRGKPVAAQSAADGVRVQSIHVENYLGLALFDATFPPRGAVIEGRNGGGKSSVLKAITAALTAQGIDASAIHLGATKAEIRVDLGDVTVRRVITEKGGTLRVSRPDGSIFPAPQGYLRDLLGVSSLDPLAFWAEKDAKKRRKLLLDALHVEVTPAMLRTWAGGAMLDAAIATACGAAPSFFTSEHEDKALPGHGLDLVEQVRAAIYGERTAANRRVKEAAATVVIEEQAHAAIVAELGEAPTLSTDEAQRAVDAVRGDEAALVARRRMAEDARKRRDGMVTRAARWRTEATAKRETAPAAPNAEEREAIEVAYKAMDESEDAAAARVAVLREKLSTALTEETHYREERERLARLIEALDVRANAARLAVEEAARLEAQAAELEGGASDLPAEPTQDEGLALDVRRTEAEFQLIRARRGVDRGHQLARAMRAKVDVEAAKMVAEKLDAAVNALAVEAPRELLANTPGLGEITIDGDVIRHKGVALDDLSGAEQMLFAVRLAKALNSRSKILLVDGLEAVDPERLAAFVAEATADGYQLIAARVASGDARVEPIVAPAQIALLATEGAVS